MGGEEVLVPFVLSTRYRAVGASTSAATGGGDLLITPLTQRYAA